MKKALILLFIFSCSYSLRITEIFTGNGDFFDREEKYIEIFNDGEEIIQIQNLEVRIYTNQNSYVKVGLKTTIFSLDLPDVLSKNEIKPFETAVLISSKFTNHFGLLPFSSNCIVLHPSSETAWMSSWHSKISNVQIYLNGAKVFETGPLILKEENFKSFSFDGEKFIKSGLSPGFPFVEYISSSNLIVKPLELIQIFGVANGKEKLVIKTTKSFYSEERDVEEGFSFFWRVPLLKNGENIIFEAKGKRLVLRFVDLTVRSDFYGKIFLNELVGDPKKDYSGGGWTGEDGGGTINSTDDWVELLNTSEESLNIDNLFFLEKGINVKKLIVRTNSTSLEKKNFSKGFLVVSPDGGLSLKGDLYLFEGHPFKGGKVIDYIDYNIIGLSSTSFDDESLSVLIQGNTNLPKDRIIKKTKASYLIDNSPISGFLCYFFDKNELNIFVADRSILDTNLNINLKNGFDEENLVLKKEDFYFSGGIKIVESSVKYDGILGVGKGSYTKISYTNLFSYNLVSEIWSYVSLGWNLPEFGNELKDVVIYPNPILSGNKKIKITNFPEGAHIFLLDNRGNILKSEIAKEKIIEWEENFLRGFYLIAIHYNGRKVVKKLFVY
ncbi:MAG: T9SS type A sorting domain-containing protein [Brevinematales bacterium]|nr:T9SS type A sorting domain-containing protein [Brevinematales bacterium]